ncbi:hypothetical protein PV10_08762 [Exophiala mesophila]|uniref:Uncharacterized protein n=1 Tax=Exophiala mesophila TaxID=212818 RepID=A0A0D1XLX1_EXOME|nr:uncharacterized protein PV10_08762 [Exophiala mesophila]KIV89171.1 hypothetical protein PV10_08762 [Exophiala mesophila]
MVRAEDAVAYVHQGFWINWTKGRPMGATLTLEPQNAAILIAIVAVYVQLVGSQLWKLVVFLIHQLRATQAEKDGFYHQQQVILRNTGTEMGAVWQLIRVGFAWRHHVQLKATRRSLPLILIASLHFAAFNVASIFSSRLLDAGDEALSISPFCGVFNDDYMASMGTSSVISMPNSLVVEYSAYIQSRYQQSQQYVEFCSTPSSVCRHLPRQTIPWNVTINDSCPFAQAACLPGLNQSIVLDTGLLSSHRHFGINSPAADRVQYRKVTTCTILNDAEYITDWHNISATNSTPAKQVVDAYYGPNPIADRNATFSYSEWTHLYSFDQYSITNPYQMSVQYTGGGTTPEVYSDFVPIPELARSDADVMLAFLSFSKVYEAAVDDPWFRATVATTYPVPESMNPVEGTVYKRDKPVTTLACAEQHQLCVDKDSDNDVPTSDKCTPLGGWFDTAAGPNSIDVFDLTPQQGAVAQRLFQSAVDSSFYSVLLGLAQRDTPLLARRSIQGLTGMGLPIDQWQNEVRYWSNISMANLQRSVVDFSTGRFAADTSYINTTLSPAQSWLCQNQIIRGTSYRSFDMFALIFILVLGLIIIIVGSTIEDCLALRRKRQMRQGKTTSSYRQEMWVRNEMLDMLRMLFERQGYSTWGRSSNGVPISGPGQMMKIADLETTDNLELYATQDSKKPRSHRWRIAPSGNSSAGTLLKDHDIHQGVESFEFDHAQGEFLRDLKLSKTKRQFTVDERYSSDFTALPVHDDGQGGIGHVMAERRTSWGLWGERPRRVPQAPSDWIGRAY